VFPARGSEQVKALLDALAAAIAATLPYLSWVGVLDNELLPPEEPAFPLVGLRDGGIVHASQPGRTDLDTLTVHVIPYQSIVLTHPGGAVMGSEAQLGDQGKGLLDISAALRTLLNDNFLGLAGIHYAHCDRQAQTQTLPQPSGALIQLQRLTFTYRRITS